MSKGVGKKTELLVYGYIKETFSGHTPNIIRYNISLFYNSKNVIPFNVYNQYGHILNKNIDNIIEIYVIGSSQLYITNDNRLYVNGKNHQGRLGIGHPNARKHANFNEIKIFNGIGIELISQARESPHCLIYTNDNKLYGCGNNKYKGISFKSNNDFEYCPILISDNLPFKSKLIKIETGVHHTIFLNEIGNVFGCGRNNHFQLSFNDTAIHYDITLMNSFNNVMDICCAAYASYILTYDNKLYSFGLNNFGCLGIKEQTLKRVKQTIINSDIENNIIQINSGTKHVSILTSMKEVYLFGWNLYGQCGIKNYFAQSIPTPTKLIFDKNILNIKCGGRHNIIKCNNNEYYSFGNNNNCQCLVPSNFGETNRISVPQMISSEIIMKKTRNNAPIIDIIPTRSASLILQKN